MFGMRARLPGTVVVPVDLDEEVAGDAEARSDLRAADDLVARRLIAKNACTSAKPAPATAA